VEVRVQAARRYLRRMALGLSCDGFWVFETGIMETVASRAATLSIRGIRRSIDGNVGGKFVSK
jgi:hypothetical protein